MCTTVIYKCWSVGCARPPLTPKGETSKAKVEPCKGVKRRSRCEGLSKRYESDVHVYCAFHKILAPQIPPALPKRKKRSEAEEIPTGETEPPRSTADVAPWPNQPVTAGAREDARLPPYSTYPTTYPPPYAPPTTGYGPSTTPYTPRSMSQWEGTFPAYQTTYPAPTTGYVPSTTPYTPRSTSQWEGTFPANPTQTLPSIPQPKAESAARVAKVKSETRDKAKDKAKDKRRR